MMHLLAATDFSEHGNEAVNYALELAAALGARLHILHAYRTQGSAALVMHNMQELLEADAIAGMEGLVQRIQPKADQLGVGLSSSLFYGEADEAVKVLVRNQTFDLLVLGNKGKSGLDTLFFGSVSRSVIENMIMPTLLIPHGATFQGWKRLSYAVNLLENRKPGHLQYLMAMCTRLNTQLETVYVHEEGHKPDTAEHNHRLWLKEALGASLSAEIELEGEDVIVALFEHSEKQRPDVLVVSSHQYSFFERLLVPGLSRRLAEKSKVPLLLLPIHAL
jgi:nucleotide-binding universal stress UspA family protein